MSDNYVGAHEQQPGECTFESHFDDCFIGCQAPRFPGEPQCVDHFIAAAHARADQETQP